MKIDNPRYTFDNFVVGNNNQFAFYASKRVAEHPGKIYNPLFLYGRPSLGKTHLMCAIAHYIRHNHPEMKVLYMTSEEFTNDVIDAIRRGKTDVEFTIRFREKYRSIDVLLLDNIQWIIGKDATQEELFHTFNTLHESGKQIVLSSDRPPKDMPLLDERFKSRFEWGLMAEIQSPDYETRVSILKRKLEIHNQSINEEIIEFIATHIKSDIRLLEGALNKVLSLSNIEKTAVNMDMAQEALIDVLPKIEKKPDKILFTDKEITIAENHRISGYINSNAIRNHLRAIQYKFSPHETAWLIWQCQHLTLQEKHDEWKEIIDQSPDMKFRTCGGTSPEMDLHDFLTRYMEIDNIWMDRFMRPEQDIYRYSLRLTTQDGTFSYVDSDCFFSSYEFCLEAARKDAAEYDEQECRNLRIRIIKKKINDTKERSGYMELCLNSHFEILDIDDLGYSKDDEEDNIHITFEEMWFSFPVPFQKGDILYNTTRSYDHFCAGPMVLTVAAPEHYNKKGRKGNDLSDMWVAGYFQDNDDGTVYAENDYNYMEYDYCPPEQLTGKKRLLLALSNFLKDEIGIDLFMEACAQIIGEEYVQDHFKRLSSLFSKEGLELAGLCKKE